MCIIENWRDIKNYKGLYQVSDMGTVKNLKSNKILKLFPDNKGYLQVKLYKNKEGKTFKVHRLVAEAFIPNPNNKPTVDHINTIRTDNRVTNLRWFTYEEQANDNLISNERIKKHASNVGKSIGKRNLTKAHKNNNKKVLCITTGDIFNSAKEAADHYKLSRCSVSDAANPNYKRKTAGKLSDGTPLEWKYVG